jgi:hypothetical protein
MKKRTSWSGSRLQARLKVLPDTARGWTEINFNPARKINPLDLNNGVLESLGEMPIGAGQYTQVRLVLVPNSGGNVANSVVLSGAIAEIPVATPSAVQSGIKLMTVTVGSPDCSTVRG